MLEPDIITLSFLIEQITKTPIYHLRRVFQWPVPIPRQTRSCHVGVTLQNGRSPQNIQIGVAAYEWWDGAKYLANAMVNADNPLVSRIKKRSQVKS